jgi:hypothetical protein
MNRGKKSEKKSCRNGRYYFSICIEMLGKTMNRFGIADVLSETRTRVFLNIRQKRFLLRYLVLCDLSHEQNIVILISPNVVKSNFFHVECENALIWTRLRGI